MVSPSVPDFVYLTYKVSKPSTDSDEVNLLTTVASTPEISPLMFTFPSDKTFV